jgi:hypothetical protein
MSDVLDDIRITFTFLEIYNEKIRDLLLNTEESNEGGWDTSNVEASSIPFQSTNPNTLNPSLKVREHPVLGPYVEGLSKPVVHTIDDVLQLLSLGLSKRSTASTILNNQSSRSHAVVTLEISYSNNTTVPKSSRKSNLFSPTVSFSHSMKTGGLFSPEKLDLNEEPKSGTTPFKDEKKDAQDKNRTVVKVQMVDLAGSEKDSTHPNKTYREDDETDLSNYNRNTNKKKSQEGVLR